MQEHEGSRPLSESERHLGVAKGLNVTTGVLLAIALIVLIFGVTGSGEGSLFGYVMAIFACVGAGIIGIVLSFVAINRSSKHPGSTAFISVVALILSIGVLLAPAIAGSL